MKKNEWAMWVVKNRVVNEKAKSFQLREYHEKAEASQITFFYILTYSTITLLIGLGFSSGNLILFSLCGLAASLFEYGLNTSPLKALAEASIKAHQDPEILKVIQENNCPSYIPERKNV